MQYAITGAAGHISSPLAKQLLHAGHSVTVIGRSKEHLRELVAAGAQPAIGAVEDRGFLKAAFADADAVYTMYPGNFAVPDLKAFIEQTAENYAEAIRANGIRFIVNLSSVGAHLPAGVGPVSGLHRAENILNGLNDVNITHLRPCYFFSNLLSYVDMIKNMGMMGSNFSLAESQFPVADTNDIASVAATALLNLDFKGHVVRYIASDETGTDEIATTVGRYIGKPELKWIKFTDEQALGGMQQAGMPAHIAREYVEMFNALDSGKMLEDYSVHRPELSPTKLEDFARRFAAEYHANEVLT